MASKIKRTTHRSSKGTKLYAVRERTGKFKDIQTYKRAHGGDLRQVGTQADRRRRREPGETEDEI